MTHANKKHQTRPPQHTCRQFEYMGYLFKLDRNPHSQDILGKPFITNQPHYAYSAVGAKVTKLAAS